MPRSENYLIIVPKCQNQYITGFFMEVLSILSGYIQMLQEAGLLSVD